MNVNRFLKFYEEEINLILNHKSAILKFLTICSWNLTVARAHSNTAAISFVQGYGQYWIGLNDREIEWTFRWTDGAPVTFTLWSPSEPNNFENKDEDCVTMYAYVRNCLTVFTSPSHEYRLLTVNK